MSDSELGNSELGRFQLGDTGLSGPPDFTVIVTNSFTVSQVIILANHIITVSITNSASVSQLVFVNSPVIVSVSNQAYVQQFIVITNATFIVSVSNSALISQAINARNGIFRVALTNTINVAQNIIIRDVIVIVSLANSLNATQRINSEYRLPVTNSANVTQIFDHTRFINQAFSNEMTLADTFEVERNVNLILRDTPTLLDSYTFTGSIERDLENIEILTDIFRAAILIGPGGLPHPIVTGIPVLSSTQTLIESKSLTSPSSIILPAAEFGDTFAPKLQNTLKKTVTGKIYTYIKTNQASKISLTFTIGLKKALELQVFLKTNDFKSFYTLSLWNGEIWSVKIISSDINSALTTLSHEGRWQGGEIDKMSVTVDFEGVKLL